MMDNQVTLVGNATRDPELSFTNSGLAITNFGLAVNHRKFNKDTQEYDEETHFFDVACFRDLAENVAETVGRGTRVIVVGRLTQRRWETDAGEKRNKIEINADHVGPDLTWATAQVQKTNRSGASSSGGGNQAPAASAPAQESNEVDLEEPF